MDIPAACYNARSLLLRSGDLATAPKNYQKAVTIAEALSGADASDRRELSGYAIAVKI